MPLSSIWFATPAIEEDAWGPQQTPQAAAVAAITQTPLSPLAVCQAVEDDETGGSPLCAAAGESRPSAPPCVSNAAHAGPAANLVPSALVGARIELPPDFEWRVNAVVNHAFASLQVSAGSFLALRPDAVTLEESGSLELLWRHLAARAVHSVSCPRLLVAVCTYIAQHFSAADSALFQARYVPHFHTFLEERCGYGTFVPRALVLAHRHAPDEFASRWPDFDLDASELAYGGSSGGLAGEGEEPSEVSQTDRRVAPATLFCHPTPACREAAASPQPQLPPRPVEPAGSKRISYRSNVRAERAVFAHRRAMEIAGTPIVRTDQQMLAAAGRVCRGLIRRCVAARYAEAVLLADAPPGDQNGPPDVKGARTVPVQQPHYLRALTTNECWKINRQVHAEIECCTVLASLFHHYGRREAQRLVQQMVNGINRMVRDVLPQLPRHKQTPEGFVAYVQGHVSLAQLGPGRGAATLFDALQLGCSPSAVPDLPFSWSAVTTQSAGRSFVAVASKSDHKGGHVKPPRKRVDLLK